MTIQVKNFLLVITIYLLVGLVVGCNPSPDVDRDTAKGIQAAPNEANPGTPPPPSRPTDIEPITATVSVLLTATNDHIATSALLAMVAGATATETPTPEPTPAIEPETPGGSLFISSFDEGLLRVAMETSEVERLVPKEEDWLVWGFAVSPDEETVAYWIHTPQKSELWLSNLVEWSPELILSFSDLEHDTFILWWISNDYLLLEPSIISQRYNDFSPVRAYIINRHQKQVEVEDTGFAFGCLLAPSPKTSELATWCPAKENWIDIQSYYTAPVSYYVVMEETGFLWTTTRAPAKILAQLRTPNDRWEWSHNRNLVAFPLYDAEKGRSSLHLVERSTLASFVIDQPEVRYYSMLDWAPNDLYIAYDGTCAAYACDLINSIISKEIIWTSQMVPGLQSGSYLAWSYDSQYVALQFEGITIVNIQDNEVVQRLDIPSAFVLVWLP
ncbi:MAG: hypothetical protein H6650_17575 [Ardenticatenales bacterium]|nr:hypothetical protein [Ardenticatenales bacterium]